MTGMGWLGYAEGVRGREGSRAETKVKGQDKRHNKLINTRETVTD